MIHEITDQQRNKQHNQRKQDEQHNKQTKINTGYLLCVAAVVACCLFFVVFVLFSYNKTKGARPMACQIPPPGCAKKHHLKRRSTSGLRGAAISELIQHNPPGADNLFTKGGRVHPQGCSYHQADPAHLRGERAKACAVAPPLRCAQHHAGSSYPGEAPKAMQLEEDTCRRREVSVVVLPS